MESTIPQGRLAEIVRAARSRTRVPAVAAGLYVDGSVELVDGQTPFRIASVSKWFTASLASASGVLNDETRRLLSHTAGLRPEVAEPLPEACRGLWSYANSGFWAAADTIAAATGKSFSDAMQARILEPLGLDATSYGKPPGAMRGHLQKGVKGHVPAPPDAYPVERRPSGGLWSTVSDLLRFAQHQFDDPYGIQTPQVKALGAEYCLGCWRRELAGGRIAFDHEGSAAGFQSLLLIVPAERVALSVLTNSWRGSDAIRHVVHGLGLTPAATDVTPDPAGNAESGVYTLDEMTASVTADADRLRIAETEIDPISGTQIDFPPFTARPLGDNVFGIAGGLLMSHRVDFPRPGVARIGWVATPREDTP
jgi:CubicO group peptidase (beta-lactamase class C family)